MIKLTLQGKLKKEFYLNPHMIESIDATGSDVVIQLLSGKSIMVSEDVEAIQMSIIAYRKEIGCFKNEE
ncbi:flagellar FlbD family protein [Entomospira nematocerorum]|uniref:Flagellar FlbD family protein n=1 Tax=Entomospira nematocerorum TaxID=2719987 RepID=A0A968GCR0_9SPIO|nr:flagellar FlbD family protein [Entomospira nematocera]NIZ47452.1 flagellar FlbD family protein [Entomospira nematocera]WDI34009.1 flagellar FlbD family protein [Entomospira nematocera]